DVRVDRVALAADGVDVAGKAGEEAHRAGREVVPGAGVADVAEVPEALPETAPSVDGHGLVLREGSLGEGAGEEGEREEPHERAGGPAGGAGGPAGGAAEAGRRRVGEHGGAGWH